MLMPWPPPIPILPKPYDNRPNTTKPMRAARMTKPICAKNIIEVVAGLQERLIQGFQALAVYSTNQLQELSTRLPPSPLPLATTSCGHSRESGGPKVMGEHGIVRYGTANPRSFSLAALQFQGRQQDQHALANRLLHVDNRQMQVLTGTVPEPQALGDTQSLST